MKKINHEKIFSILKQYCTNNKYILLFGLYSTVIFSLLSSPFDSLIVETIVAFLLAGFFILAQKINILIDRDIDNEDTEIMITLFLIYIVSFLLYLFVIDSKVSTPLENYLISFILSGVSFFGIVLIASILFKDLKYAYHFINNTLIKLKSIVKSLLFYFVIPLFIVLTITTYLVRPFSISGGSMNQTFHDGDSIIGTVFGLNSPIPFSQKTLINNIESIKRGDVVFFKMEDVYYVKRIIALPGDIVSYDEQTKLYTINGKIEEHDSYEINVKNSEMTKSDFFSSILTVFKEIGDTGYIESKMNIARRSGFYKDLNITYVPINSYPFKTPTLNPVNITNYKVPINFLFVGGDNRISSVDSRYFGPIPFDLVRGKAIFQYMGHYPFVKVIP